ncbi:MAG: cupredoxin family copper-binding protein [Chloroflexi bacterium]|nr:cupredoxin family copper-binding protein [Chloroflexota bacterium]
MEREASPSGWSPLVAGVALAGGLAVIAVAWWILLALSTHGTWRLWDTRDHMQTMGGAVLDSSNATIAVGGADRTIDIRDFAFRPAKLEIPAGARVTFTNHDGAPHTATAKDESWDTGVLQDGGASTLSFYRRGEFPYYCKLHPEMEGRLLVE